MPRLLVVVVGGDQELPVAEVDARTSTVAPHPSKYPIGSRAPMGTGRRGD